MLEVQEECFHCELPVSIVELASLNAKYTPLDKLWCLRRTLSSIESEVTSHIMKCGADFELGNGMEERTVSRVQIFAAIDEMLSRELRSKSGARFRGRSLTSEIVYHSKFRSTSSANKMG